ncbi:acyl-CoA dehydrogenase family protein [Nocardioides carbamazepini]|uniref:acyl-CoA dehydrogenase family protein n=1 Tax=Nocardioides carbamazepini TaxID=2854259 RepID=UPI002149C257|nr:acyl-CoA dehydrogenase family protein [Nocardioides carbamazepini]MCR1784913.1 acyl-CoA dehydrogenase family protein [Nocardioides carbamazepini]
MIDFEIPAELAERRDRIRRFVAEQVVPYETDPRITAHGPSDELRQELVELARAAGLLTFQAPAEYGGTAPSHVEQAVLFEAAGWSTIGPVALNCAAPDEGNMFLLGKVCSPEQAETFLRPVIEGHQRSVFAMTEPDGAGADPSQLTTTAVRDGAEFVINGRKWLITGADGGRVWIIMARVEPGSSEHGPTLFLCDGDTPGIVIERTMDTIDRNYVGGHGVVRFDDLRLPASAVLGEVGQALRYAQLRLAPARLTHCMRWLGAAERAHSIAVDHAKRRTAFGKPIGQHQGVGFMLADNEIALQQCRLAIWWACWTLDQGHQGRHESSMVKTMVSEELYKLADRCVQILGGMGISDETPVAGIFRDLRAFRLYDGPTEVHKFAISRAILRD